MIFSPRIRIKMCGMTRGVDIQHAIALGVDAIGLIFYSRSPRAVNIAQAKQLLQGLPAFVDVVAVLVNPVVSFVDEIMSELPVQWLQFHGDETPAFCEQFKTPYIKAVPALSSEAIIEASSQYHHASALLLDTPIVGLRGGSGQVFDWDMIPPQSRLPLVLAGGLDANNVNSAISSALPHAVDVCSGIEVSAGIKDHNKMTAFVSAVWPKS